MKVLLSWLREFAPIEGDPVELGHRLSSLGLAVEELEVLGANLDGVVVAKVLDLRPHPDADRIQLVDVDAGDGQPLQICCGAFNMSVGDTVPLATIGTVMPNGMEIAKRKMRGQESNGMLCSAAELNLGGDGRGILLLPDDLTAGVPLKEALGVGDDVLYDLEVNPNRPDCMSVAGVARDLAASLGVPFSLPEPKVPVGTVPASSLASLEVVDGDLCGRFVANVLQGVTVGASSPEVAARLTLLGMRPINSLVDISNYVMLELGQPNHPYDLAKLAGGGLRVRRARQGETLVTLDEVERAFIPDDLLICDATDLAVGIAGIMGGASTEIDASTTDVLLEMAWFKPMSIARTARRLGLRTEASARFERGCDPEVIDRAAARFVELLADQVGSVASEPLRTEGELPDRTPVHVRTTRVNQLLGTQLTPNEIKGLLDPIEFRTEIDGDDVKVTIPTFRYDSAVEIDIVEEVARTYGYIELGKTVPRPKTGGSLTARQHERRGVRYALAGLGLSEVTPMPFLAPGQIARCGLHDDGIEITNPLVSEESILRPALLPGLVAAVAYNASHRNHGVGFFEIGHVFRRPADPNAELPDERENLGAILAGRDAIEAVRTWGTLVDLLDLPEAKVRNGEVDGLHPTRSATVEVAGTVVGSVGEIDPEVLRRHSITERVAYLEVDLGLILDLPHGAKEFKPFSLYPSSDIDLAFEVDESVPADLIADAITEAGGPLVKSVALFDVYRGDGVAVGRRSLAYTVRFQAPDRTLTDDDVAQVRQQCIDAVQSAFPATLRG